jgi:hypothetical protein
VVIPALRYTFNDSARATRHICDPVSPVIYVTTLISTISLTQGNGNPLAVGNGNPSAVGNGNGNGNPEATDNGNDNTADGNGSENGSENDPVAALGSLLDKIRTG